MSHPVDPAGVPPSAAPIPALAAPTPVPHRLVDDAQGLGYGAVMGAVSVHLLAQLGLVTGQTAGLALLIGAVTGWAFGPVFFLLNLPFYVMGYRRFGAGFVLRTMAAVSLMSGLTLLLPGWLAFAAVQPVFGAVLAGLLAGSALLALFRHRASLGGIGILALHVQDRLGWRAGWVQLGVDAAIFAAAFWVLAPEKVALSALGAAATNLVIAINHRPGRYLA